MLQSTCNIVIVFGTQFARMLTVFQDCSSALISVVRYYVMCCGCLLVDWYGIIYDIDWCWSQRTGNYNIWR